MSTTTDDNYAAASLALMKELLNMLREGVQLERLRQEFSGKYVGPGVSVMQHVDALRRAGHLEESGEMIKLKPR